MAVSSDERTAVITDPVDATIHIVDGASHRERFVIDVARDSVLPTAEVAARRRPSA